MNVNDPFDKPSSTIIFDKAIVDMYKDALAQAQNNIANLPEVLRYFSHAFNVTINLPKPMFRRWGRKFVDNTGRAHEPNDLVCDKLGNPKIYDKFRILCKKTLDDETGELDWAEGWDPVSRANAYISSFFVEATQSSTQKVEPPVLNAPVDVVQQPVQQQQVVQPVAQPVIQQQPVAQPAPQVAQSNYDNTQPPF